MKKFLFCFLCVVFLSYELSAQTITSNGAVIQVNSGAIMYVNGGIDLTNSTNLINNGAITSTINSTFPVPGNFQIRSSSSVTSNGTLNVEQNWLNDALFNGGTGTVTLFGNLQEYITSTNGTITTFNNLTLTGSGIGANRKKSLLAIDAKTGTNGILSINDRELATDTNTFYVLNTSTLAITNSTTPDTEGFVSSLIGGTLSRETNSSSAYIFPTGSSIITTRYRPIEITPNAITTNTYTVRMNNNDATIDGFNLNSNDSIQCLLNDKYYHSILRSTGATSADIKMHYIVASDGTWDGMAHWQISNTKWNDMSTVSLGTSGIFSTVSKNAWNFANPGEPYVLTTIRPATPVISCPLICENTIGNMYSLTGNSSNYLWTVPSGATIISGQGTDSINVDWTTGSGYVYVYAVGTGGCNSFADSCLSTAVPLPTAYFTATGEGTSDFNDTYIFSDSSLNAATWTWNFGDGSTSGLQNPTYQYNGAGDYTVILTVANSAGCTDSDTLIVTAGEGMIIPNIFTPNNDNANDEYYIQSGGLTEFELLIFNRWGQNVFSSQDVKEHWDGNFNGAPCTDGTYYFILKAKSLNKDYSTTGNITLIRKK